MPLTDAQLSSIQTTERIASCFSLVGTIFILVTFLYSPNFRKPINRLVFYASWGNMLCNVATLMSESPIRAGPDSRLCQFQGFLIQMFVPADALWNLAMAINVYLTLFKKYNAERLKALEWRYHLMAYGTTFVIAFVLVFVETQSRGKIYGPAVLWCWIRAEWDFMRIAVLYGPAWIAIVISLAIYLFAGYEIFQKRHQLRAFNVPVTELPLPVYNPSNDSNQIQVTREFASVPQAADNRNAGKFSDTNSDGSVDKSYTVNISARHVLAPNPSSAMHTSRKNRAGLEANRAAFGYAKVAALFFVSLLVTWVPSSVNRVYSLIHPNSVNANVAFAAGMVLSLMGFWNAVIYVATSWRACKIMFDDIFKRSTINDVPVEKRRVSHSRGSSNGNVSGRWDDGDSMEELAKKSNRNREGEETSEIV